MSTYSDLLRALAVSVGAVAELDESDQLAKLEIAYSLAELTIAARELAGLDPNKAQRDQKIGDIALDAISHISAAVRDERADCAEKVRDVSIIADCAAAAVDRITLGCSREPGQS